MSHGPAPPRRGESGRSPEGAGRSVLDLGEAAGYEHPIELPQFRHL